MEEVLGDAGEDIKVRVAPWWGRVFTRSFIIEAESQIVLRRKKCSLFPLTSPKTLGTVGRHNFFFLKTFFFFFFNESYSFLYYKHVHFFIFLL